MRLAYTAEEVAEMVGIGRSKLYQHINTGQLQAKKLGRRTIVLKNDLEAYVLELESYEPR